MRKERVVVCASVMAVDLVTRAAFVIPALSRKGAVGLIRRLNLRSTIPFAGRKAALAVCAGGDLDQPGAVSLAVMDGRRRQHHQL